MHLLNKRQLAERLSMSVSKLTKLRGAGEPFFSDKAVRVGGQIVWKSTDVDAYITALPYAE